MDGGKERRGQSGKKMRNRMDKGKDRRDKDDGKGGKEQRGGK